MRYRENYRNATLDGMQADVRREREKPPVGPVIMDATTPGYGLKWVALAGAVALVVMALGIIYW